MDGDKYEPDADDDENDEYDDDEDEFGENVNKLANGNIQELSDDEDEVYEPEYTSSGKTNAVILSNGQDRGPPIIDINEFSKLCQKACMDIENKKLVITPNDLKLFPTNNRESHILAYWYTLYMNRMEKYPYKLHRDGFGDIDPRTLTFVRDLNFRDLNDDGNISNTDRYFM